MIPIVISGMSWPAIAGELPDHLLPRFGVSRHGAKGKTIRAHLSAEDARLVRMAALRAERALLRSREPGSEDSHKVMAAAQACERLALRILADLQANGEAP